jgi:hypothetical protein
MSLEDDKLDSCNKPLQSKFSDLGKQAGNYLLHGLLEDEEEIYKQEMVEQEIASHGNAAIALSMWTDFARGIGCTDPTDVHFINQKGYVIDLPAEDLTNRVLQRLDRFSTKSTGDYSKEPPQTPEEAVKDINAMLQNAQVWNKFPAPQKMREDFVDDFNRRRLENNYLPNFDAYIDDSDKQVKIRQLVLKAKSE